MESREAFNQFYQKMQYPSEYQDYIYDIFLNLIKVLEERLQRNKIYRGIDYSIVVRYLAEEHINNMNLLEKSLVDMFMNDPNYEKHLILVCSDKIFFNEYNEFYLTTTITKTDPLISTIAFYLNIIMGRLELITRPEKRKDFLMLDMLTKIFYTMKSILILLTEGFEAEAYASWRTVHEIECVVKILDEHEEVADSYYKHIQMEKSYRSDSMSVEDRDAFFEDLKAQMKSYDLKSKDMKKYLEYGWLYGIENYQEKYPLLRLNFRKGVEYVAGLDQYSFDYEACSEVAHGSVLAVYSNRFRMFYRNRTLIDIYDSFMRSEEYFFKLYKELSDDYKYYELLRNLYNEEVFKNSVKIKMINEIQEKNAH